MAQYMIVELNKGINAKGQRVISQENLLKRREAQVKITDKSQKHGLRTKNVTIRGYPSVIFCSAGLKIDEQEATRFLLLSPETNQ